MPAAPKWTPPPDPDLKQLARNGWAAWERDRPRVVAFDTETTGLEYHDVAFCATVAWYSPCEDPFTGQPIGVEGHYFEFERIDCREAVLRILREADVLVAHNAKFDLHKMEREGFVLRPDQELHDTEAMAHLVDEHQDKGLKDLAVNVLGFSDLMDVPGKAKNPDYYEGSGLPKTIDVVRQIPRSKYLIDKARDWAKKEHGLSSVKDVGYQLLPRGVVVPYAILDAEWTLELARILHPQVTRFPDLAELYAREMKLTRGAIYAMEKAGLKVDVEYVAQQVIEYRKKCLAHEARIEQIVGKPVRTGDIPKKERDQWFNPSSSAPDARVFFAERGFERDSYDADSLRTIDHPLAGVLLAYRKDLKILEGYFVSLQKETGPDGIFHQSSRQHGTVSGRTSGGRERGDR